MTTGQYPVAGLQDLLLSTVASYHGSAMSHRHDTLPEIMFVYQGIVGEGMHRKDHVGLNHGRTRSKNGQAS